MEHLEDLVNTFVDKLEVANFSNTLSIASKLNEEEIITFFTLLKNRYVSMLNSDSTKVKVYLNYISNTLDYLNNNYIDKIVLLEWMLSNMWKESRVNE